MARMSRPTGSGSLSPADPCVAIGGIAARTEPIRLDHVSTTAVYFERFADVAARPLTVTSIEKGVPLIA